MSKRQSKRELQSLINPIKKHLQFLDELRLDLKKNKRRKEKWQKYSK